MRRIIRFIKALTSSIPSSFEFRAGQQKASIGMDEIREEWDFSNPLIEIEEVPIPVLPSNFTFGTEPLGYMWNDGVMTATEDRNSRIIKRLTEWDEWIQIEGHPVSEEKIPNSDTYIL